MTFNKITPWLLFGIIAVFCTSGFSNSFDLTSAGFLNPSDSARPWVYWFWMDGNITEEGITADLESMQRVGIGGVLIMEISVSQPVGPVVFMSDRWRELFHHAVKEAARLGLEVTMNAGPGWNGSGGRWITPENSMQLLSISETKVSGPGSVAVALPQPKIVENYYRDITVLAFPTPAATKARFPEYDPISSTLYRLVVPSSEISKEDIVPLSTILELKECMDAEGNFVWNVPAGEWTVLRVGHTSKGVECSPAPISGQGLECDKLSRTGTQAAFDGMISKLIDDNKEYVGTTFVRTHVDSWENGTQNWTPTMREEFLKRRGYDMVSWIPLFAGYIVEGFDASNMFLWDLRRTISDLVYDNYFSYLMELTHAKGLGLSTEGYWSPSDQIPYAGLTDEPMGEFWWVGAALETCRGMASSGHVYGRNIIGAEAFTAAEDERWLGYPGQMKAMADAAFCEGINRFVFHRFAMQPWLDRWPGNTMGPYGIHCDRTQTWWEPSVAWNRYLARCQELLRQGEYVADICYLETEESPQGFTDHRRLGYPWDQAGTHATLTMTVEDGWITLPSGMKYRILVLPHTDQLTPELVRKVEELVHAGATVIGAKPNRSRGMDRSLDVEVQQIANRVWGTAGGAIGENKHGKGRVIWGRTPENILGTMNIPADITADARLNSIHRRTENADLYFVVNPTDRSIPATVGFRVTGRVPQFWNPVTGEISTATLYSEVDGVTVVSMTFEPNESVFVVFDDKIPAPMNRVSTVFRYAQRVASCGTPLFRFLVSKATYGVPGDTDKKIDVTQAVQTRLDSGQREIEVTTMATISDPAPGAVKTLTIEYAFDWEPEKLYTLSAPDGLSVLMNQEAVDIEIQSARYGLLDHPEKVIDVTAFIREKVTRGENGIPVVYCAGIRDPAVGETKHLEIYYRQDGVEKSIKLRDGETVIFETTVRRPVSVRSTMEASQPVLEILEPGDYEITFDDGKIHHHRQAEMPPISIEGSWTVTFPVGIPADGIRNKEFKVFTFERLVPWNEHEDDFIKFFSGTAVYQKDFFISPGTLQPNRRYYLDLGTVDVMAQVELNGKDLGVIWTPLKRVDVTKLLQEDENSLTIKVTNLWPNKMIGDDRLPEDTPRFADGRPKEWPRWLLEGKPSPTGRETFTAWKLWNKDNEPLSSGLIGPVRIVQTVLTIDH